MLHYALQLVDNFACCVVQSAACCWTQQYTVDDIWGWWQWTKTVEIRYKGLSLQMYTTIICGFVNTLDAFHIQVVMWFVVNSVLPCEHVQQLQRCKRPTTKILQHAAYTTELNVYIRNFQTRHQMDKPRGNWMLGGSIVPASTFICIHDNIQPI